MLTSLLLHTSVRDVNTPLKTAAVSLLRVQIRIFLVLR